VERDDNPNRARAKAYHSWRISRDGYVNDGLIRAVIEAMISSFLAYLLDEYHSNQHLVDQEQDFYFIPRHAVLAALPGPWAAASMMAGRFFESMARSAEYRRADVGSNSRLSSELRGADRTLICKFSKVTCIRQQRSIYVQNS
jgi:hypothetical protein